jgi:hypothetical protein
MPATTLGAKSGGRVALVASFSSRAKLLGAVAIYSASRQMIISTS